MAKLKMKFMGCTPSGIYVWQSIPGSSRHIQYTCRRDWFWQTGRIKRELKRKDLKVKKARVLLNGDETRVMW